MGAQCTCVVAPAVWNGVWAPGHNQLYIGPCMYTRGRDPELCFLSIKCLCCMATGYLGQPGLFLCALSGEQRMAPGRVLSHTPLVQREAGIVSDRSVTQTLTAASALPWACLSPLHPVHNHSWMSGVIQSVHSEARRKQRGGKGEKRGEKVLRGEESPRGW